MCVLAAMFFLGFIFRAGTCVNVQWARSAVLGGGYGHRVLPHWGFFRGVGARVVQGTADTVLAWWCAGPFADDRWQGWRC